MRIFDYLKRLVPSFTKDDLKEKIRLVSQSLSETLQVFGDAVEFFSGKSLKSKAGRDFDSAFRSAARGLRYRGESMDIIHQILGNLGLVVEQISSLADKTFSKDIVVEGITYQRGELLRTVIHADFYVTYARQLLHYLLICEANVHSKTLPDGRERPKPEIEWLRQNREAFLLLSVQFAIPARDFIKRLNDIPDIVITENDENTVIPVVGIGKLDPLRSNFIPGVSDAAYAIGVRWANYQVARYDRLKEDIRSIQFRIEQLRLQAQGKEDAQLERSIQTYEDILNEKAEKLDKLTKEYNR